MKMINKMELLKIKKEYLIVAVVVGVALMMLGKMGKTQEAAVNDDTSESVESAFDFGLSYDDSTEVDYITYTTQNIKNCLENMEGVGKVEVFLSVETSGDSYMNSDVPVVSGIMVVAQGADNPIVVQDITEACEALFSLDAHKIKVVRMKEESK